MVQSLQSLGYTHALEALRIQNQWEHFDVGRVVSEHKERYQVQTDQGVWDAEITGAMRFRAESREDFPAIGDWVALTLYDSGVSIIHHVFPRFSVLSRQAVGQQGNIQIIAANVDFAWIVQALDRDYNMNRLERYLAICYASKVQPVIVFTKTDLMDSSQLATCLEGVTQRIPHVPMMAVSNITQEGYPALRALFQEGKTYCLLGSSGVGKSTLLNHLSGTPRMKTDRISSSTHKGRHVTTHRELMVLPQGGVLIDNPGMREVGVVEVAPGLENVFADIYEASQYCPFKNCTHTVEPGCAVLNGIQKGTIDPKAYHHYLKLEKEKTHLEQTIFERRRKDKAFGKMLKAYHKGSFEK